MNKSLASALIAAAVVAAGAAGACGSDDDAGPDDQVTETGTVRPARKFDRFQLYWAGTRYRGLSLTDDGSRDIATYPAIRSISLGYGTCAEPADGGCPLPVSIDNYRDGTTCAIERRPPWRTLELRGVPVADYGDHLEVFTRETRVEIYATAAGGERAVVEQLQSLDGRIGPGDPLPPPKRGRACPR